MEKIILMARSKISFETGEKIIIQLRSFGALRFISIGNHKIFFKEKTN